MKRIILGAVLSAAVGASAQSASYDDFSQAMIANNRGESATAVAFFSKALAAGDLSPNLMPAALLGRATAYLHEGKCQPAVADAAIVLTRTPNDRRTLAVRAAAYACLGKYTESIADENAAIALGPDPPSTTAAESSIGPQVGFPRRQTTSRARCACIPRNLTSRSGWLFRA